MVVSTKSRTFLDYLAPLASAEAWHEGLQLLETRPLRIDSRNRGLLLVSIGEKPSVEEVRYKLNENASQVAWFECSCPANRRQSKVCAHIIAGALKLEAKGQLRTTHGSMPGKTTGKRAENDFADFPSLAKSLFPESVTVDKKNRGFEFFLPTAEKIQQNLTVDQSILLSTEGTSQSETLIFEGGYALDYIDDEWNLVPSIGLKEKSSEVFVTFFCGEKRDERWKIIDLGTIPEADRGSAGIFVPPLGLVQVNNLPHSQPPLVANDLKEIASNQTLPRGLKGYLWTPRDLEIEDIFAPPELERAGYSHQSGDWFYLSPIYTGLRGEVSMFDLINRKRDGKSSRRGVPLEIAEFDWQTEDKFIKTDLIGLLRLSAFVKSPELDSVLAEKFSRVTPVPSVPLDSLRPYQQKGLEWLWNLKSLGLNGLLADEMGLGKTHQALALVLASTSQNPGFRTLVVCPTSVMDHWKEKLVKFFPTLSHALFHGPDRRLHRTNNIVITSYGILHRDRSLLSNQTWDLIVLDEAQAIKNKGTETYRSAREIPARMRLCLSGTPVENNLRELKNLFDFLLPGYFGSDRFFKKMFSFETPMSPEKVIHLKKLIAPFKLRREKIDVAPELPEKFEEKLFCTLNPIQVGLYQEVLSQKARSLHDEIENGAQFSYLHVFAIINYLKQICNHPALISPNFAATGSGKFELFADLISTAMSGGEKVVVYSHYVGMLQIISDHLKGENILHTMLTGSTRERGKVIKTFQEDPETKVMLCSLLAGGVGIDLTAASIVIHYDRWWNAAKENQATDRVHRIGQGKTVKVYKLITRGTLEEHIDSIIAKKEAMISNLVSGDGDFVKMLSKEELLKLLMLEAPT